MMPSNAQHILVVRSPNHKVYVAPFFFEKLGDTANARAQVQQKLGPGFEMNISYVYSTNEKSAKQDTVGHRSKL